MKGINQLMKPRNKVNLHGQGSNTPPVIVKWNFYDKNHSKRNWMTNNSVSSKARGNSKKSYNGNLDYCGRETEAQVIKSKRTLGYLDYQNQEYKVTSSGHFTSEGLYSNQEMKKQMKENSQKYQVSKNSLVWSGLISFSKEFFEKHHITSKQDAYEIVKNNMDQFFKDNHVDPKSMTWVGQFHVDAPHHFHIHLRVHQNKPGHFNHKTKKDEWRHKGKWNKASSFNLRKNIENFALARTSKREKVFSIIGKRDLIKYEVLGALKDSNDYWLFSKEAIAVKNLLPKNGRIQYNSKNMDQLLKSKVSYLTNLVLTSNSKIKNAWDDVNKAIDHPINKMVKTYNQKTRFGKSMVKSCEVLRVNKKNEMFSNVANQVLKFVKTNNWKDNRTLKGINEFYKTDKQKYVQAGFNKSKTKAFKFFSSNKFVSSLELQEEQEVEKALVAIARDLEKNIEKARGVQYE